MRTPHGVLRVRPGRRWPRLAAGLALCAALSGCVQMPHSGPIVEADSKGEIDQQLGYYNDPPPPAEGETPPEIVKHFLDAMAANPIQVSTARLFLTHQAATNWSPFDRTITYAESSLPEGMQRVGVTLNEANHLDGRGAWLGSLPAAQERMTFPMVREDGEWRIASAPDALIVPETWYEQNYRQVSLYFFDPTSQILIPEPVFVPRGQRLVSSLVTALIAGPPKGLSEVERTYVPTSLKVSATTRVRADGTAEIALLGKPADLSPQDAALMVAQFGWTLSQDPDITSLRLSIGGEQVTLAGGISTFSVDQGLNYDPTVLQSSSLLYGLDDGRLVSGTPGTFSRVDGPMGADDLGLSSVSVSLRATLAAGISADGTSLLVTRVRGAGSEVDTVLSRGTDLLRPTWDFADRLWTVNRPEAAQVASIVNGRSRPVTVPGITGKEVRQALISRDGSRFVAVVHTRTRDVLRVSRITYDAKGRVSRASHARTISGQLDPDVSIRDIGWVSPTSIAVLARPATTVSELRTVPVDGAPAALGSISTTWPGKVRGIASSPTVTDPLYLWTQDGLIDVTSRGATTVRLPADLTSLGYVGG
jgi:hypothetical protein